MYYDSGEFELGMKYRKEWLDYFLANKAEFKSYYLARNCCYLGLIDLKQGNVGAAKSRMIEMESLFPSITPGQMEWIQFRRDLLKKEVLIAEGSFKEAIDFCKNAKPMEMPVMLTTNMISFQLPCLNDALARAYQGGGRFDQAISEYEKLITFDPTNKERSLVHPLFHYRLARLYVERGHRGMALEQFKKFIDLWTSADTDLPEINDARARYAALQGKVGG